VGTKDANELGIYDMSGNVWEWVNDYLGSAYYNSSPAQDPQGPSVGTLRVYRGGGWDYDDWGARVSERDGNEPRKRDGALGFRLAVSAK
jgi:formylglycine-generating enzyme required for sulfatase activity